METASLQIIPYSIKQNKQTILDQKKKINLLVG